jgi:hypothetical protein
MRPRTRQTRDARRRQRSVTDADELGVALCDGLGCDAGAHSAVTKVLADRMTREGQQAPRRCRSQTPSDTNPSTPIVAEGRQHQGANRIDPTTKQSKNIERCLIGPMQILEHDHRRPTPRHVLGEHGHHLVRKTATIHKFL